MEKKNDNGKRWLLIGALASFFVAMVGIVLVLFVFNDGKKHRVDNDEEDDDDMVWVNKSWFDKFDRDKEAVKPEPVDSPDKESQQPTEITPVEDELQGPGNGDQSLYDVVDPMPQFLEGDLAVWLGSHIQYPPEAEDSSLQGTVVCQFIVEKDGSVDSVTVVRSVDSLLDKEAVRVIESMPKWAPGEKNGQPVRVKYTLPIKFQLK